MEGSEINIVLDCPKAEYSGVDVHQFTLGVRLGQMGGSLDALRRFCIAANGVSKYIFWDNSVLILAEDCGYVTHIDSGGHSTHQLLNWVLRKNRSKVEAAIAIRNSLREPLIFVSEGLVDCGEKKRHREAKTVSWSSTLQEAVQAGLVCVHEAAGVIVLSHDQSTRLQLDPSGSMAIVTFPLTSCTAAPCRTGIQTQIFPVSCLPSRWAHSLQLALAALHVTRPCGGNHSAPEEIQEDAMLLNAGAPAMDAMMQLPEPQAISGAAMDSASAQRLKNPEWWAECADGGWPTTERMLVDWSSAVGFLFYLPDSQEALATSNGHPILHTYRQSIKMDSNFAFPNNEDRMFAIGAIPRVLWLTDGAQFPLSSIAQHALSFREACVKGWHKQQVGKQSKGPYQESRILEQAEWDGSAFTAYEDGRVTVKFKDRAILDMSEDASSVNILMPDGSRLKSTLPADGLCDSYVRAALEFRRWAMPVAQGWAPFGPIQAQIELELEKIRSCGLLCSYPTAPSSSSSSFSANSV